LVKTVQCHLFRQVVVVVVEVIAEFVVDFLSNRVFMTDMVVVVPVKRVVTVVDAVVIVVAALFL
jgi:hypothetical protein